MSRRKVHLTIIDPTTPFKYKNGVVPSSYRCGVCGATGRKLWRDYNTMLTQQTLRCGRCACKEEEKDFKQLTSEGKIPWTNRHGEFLAMTDQIGSLCPAVPREENDNYWGYTSVPEPGVQWWIKLPA